LEGQGKIEVMVVPPDPALNWKNPTILTLGYLRSYAQKTFAKKLSGRERSAMGHGIVRVKCSTEAEEVDFWSGFSGNENYRGLYLLLGGAGLSIMTYNYLDGHIQSTEFVQKYLDDIIQQPKIQAGFIRMNISQEQCEIIRNHYEGFRQNGTENLIYGFFTDPLSLEGAGCTSYATSFAQKSGVFSPFLQEKWTRTIEISAKNLGPTNQASSIEGYQLKPVSFIRFINFLRPLRWKKENDKLIRFSFIDPQYMADFFRQSIECLEHPENCKNKPELLNWLKENEAELCSNEYLRGIEIRLK
ncbi:MAG TPA: hypothetical protein DCQ58_06810, partial [Saprospirales bacterium]|nr:hypothetical protein [Saprospirales bacterium]